MINIELSKQERKESKKDKNVSRMEDLVSFLRSKPCQMLKTGYSPVEIKYMFCSCDPEMKNPICEDCKERCHRDHFSIGSSITKAMCTCGLKCHNIINDHEAVNENYQKKCFFHEISETSNLNIYYDLIDDSSAICIFCHNFCTSEKHDVIYIKKNCLNTKVPECTCKHNNHSDPKTIYGIIKHISQDFVKKHFEFGNFTFTHIFNSILLSEKSFKNLYLSFLNYWETLKSNLNEPKYAFEDIVSPDCDINLAIESLSKLLAMTKHLHYYNEKLFATISDTKILFKILERNFDYNYFSIWNFKFNYLTLYIKLGFKKNFNNFPNFKIYDVENMNPLQRLLKIKLIQEGNFKEFGILDNVITMVDLLNKINEKQAETYQVIYKCYQIIKFFAKFSLISSDQVNKLCQINDEIIFNFNDAKKTLEHDNRRKSNMTNYQTQLLYNIVKSIRYLIYHYNDQCLENYLKGQGNINDLDLYHMKSDISKGITKNAINIMTFVRSYKNNDNIEEINNLISKILSEATKIISTNMHYPDFYSVGLNSMFNKNKDYFLKYIWRNFEPKEKSFFVFLKQSTNEIENLYQNYFEFQVTEKNLIEKINKSIINLFDNMGLPNYSPSFHSRLIDEYLDNIFGEINEEFLMVDEKNQNPAAFNETSNILKKVSSVNMIKKKSSMIRNANLLSDRDSKDLLSTKYKILLNSTNYLNSMIKIIKILELQNESLHNAQVSFKIDEDLLDNIIRILSFFIEKNSENCLILLTSDFVNAICCLNKKQLFKAIDLVEYALFSLIKSNKEFSSCYTQINILESIINKISGTDCIENLEKAIKIINLLTRISYVNQEHINVELRRLLQKIFNENSIFMRYKDKILKSSDDNSNLNENFAEEQNHENASINNDFASQAKYQISNFKDIMIKFLQVINYLYDGDATLNEINFLNKIMQPEEIPSILKKKNLDLCLRTEILNFFRIVYIDVIINPEKKHSLRNLIINPPRIVEDDETILSNEVLKLYEELININKISESRAVNYLQLDSAILKFELKFFENFLEHNKYLDGQIVINYLENGIILPLKVHLNKLMSVLSSMEMENHLILYEMVFYFLKMKEFIIKHPEVVKTKYNTNFKVKTIFKNKYASSKEKKTLINLVFDENELGLVRKDIELMKSTNFDVFNLQQIFKIFEKHVSTLITANYPKSLKYIFEKKKFYFTEEKVEKLRNLSNVSGMMKNEYEKKIFECIIKYADEKNKLDESSFLSVMDEENTFYSMKYRQLLIRALLFLIVDPKSSERYYILSLWSIFKLLQYDTSAVQKSIYELYELKSDLIRIKKLSNLFFINFVSILFTEFNPSSVTINFDYFSAMIIIKIFKYLCEEHNPKFQKIFFQEIKFGYYQQTLEENFVTQNTLEKNHTEKDLADYSVDNEKPQYALEIKVMSYIKVKTDISRISVAEINEEEANRSIRSKTNRVNYKDIDNKPDLKLDTLENYEENNTREYKATTNNDDQVSTQKKFKITLFDFMLSILGKIVFLAQWEKVEPNDDEHKISYYYDIFFVIIEFLIEMIQGTEKSNLEKILEYYEEDEDVAKHFVEFLNCIKPILYKDKNNSIVLYRVRKDITDFLMAFLEEKSTPTELVTIMSTVIHPNNIVETIVNVMKKLYLKLNKIEKDYKDIEFDYTMFKFFSEIYFKDLSFCENEEFELANRMYQYVKLLAENERYMQEDAINIIESVSNFSESNFLKINSEKSKSDTNDFLSKGEAAFDDSFYNNYFCVKFFERITRTVLVQLEEKSSDQENHPVRVIFTLNPLMIYLSDNSRKDFFNKVKRDGRFIKLFSLMEQSEEFYDEIKFNVDRANPLLDALNKINYFWFEIIAFIITCAINIYMIAVLKQNDEFKKDFNQYQNIRILAVINLVYNCIISILWFYVKFNLYFLIEMKKINQKRENEISNLDYLKIIFYIIFVRNEVLSFLWNVFFSAIGVSNNKYFFVFALQLLIVVNLSDTLKNIALSMTTKWNQLLITFFFNLIICYIFAFNAFFYFSEDFLFNIWDPENKVYSNAENFCATMVYCWLSHVDEGLRADGGIGEEMDKRHSYTYDKAYYIQRFFYEDLYFILVNFIILSILFGIVIDAFAELLDESQKVEYDKLNICFICGASREQLEKKNKNFIEHTKNVHDIWTYVDYMIGNEFYF